MSKITGGCLCGSVRYEINTAPVMSAICHCTHCRRQSGSAFSTVAAFPVSTVSVTGDSITGYNDTGASGLGIVRKFCNKCGSPLFSDADVLPDLLFVKTGTLDEPDLIPMGAEIWCSSKLADATLGKDLPQFQQNPTS